MAKATAKTAVEAYKETVTKYREKPAGVTLELTDHEAQALLEVCAHIGGDPLYTGRAHLDKISDALVFVGYKKSDSKYDGYVTGSLMFNESKKSNW